METKQEKEFRDSERLDLPSASGMEIVVKCPGSVRLKATLPPEAFQKDEQEDEWAQRGTRVHKARETGSTLDLDEDEAEIFRQGITYEDEIVQKWMKDKGLEDCEEGPKEMRVWLHDPLRFPELLGSVQLDVHYYNKTKGCVLSVDWKTGWSPNLSPSPRSWQLRFGAVALWKEEYGDWMKECRVAHCKAQQKCTVNDYCDYGEQDLVYSWQSIAFHIWESTQPDAPLHAGPHCNWCPCKSYCVAAGAYSMMPTIIAKRVPQSNMMDWDGMVQQMQPADLLRIWENSSIVTKILDAVKGRLKSMSLRELSDLGLEFGKGRKLDPISNVPEAFNFLRDQFTETEVLACMSLSKTKLTELLSTQKGLGKEAAGQWINTKLDEWITRCQSEAPLKRMKERLN